MKPSMDHNVFFDVIAARPGVYGRSAYVLACAFVASNKAADVDVCVRMARELGAGAGHRIDEIRHDLRLKWSKALRADASRFITWWGWARYHYVDEHGNEIGTPAAAADDYKVRIVIEAGER